MKKRYPKLNVGISLWQPPVMAFVFEKSGTRVFFGSLDLIQNWLKIRPLCHGIVHYYTRGTICLRRWEIFGKPNFPGRRVQLIRTNNRKNRYTISNFSRKQITEKRNTWYLMCKDHYNETWFVLHSWRKLPSTYLKQLSKL